MPGASSPLDEFEPLPEHLQPIWRAFGALGAFDEVRPTDIREHMRILGVPRQAQRRWYVCLMALESERQAFVAAKVKAERDRLAAASKLKHG